MGVGNAGLIAGGHPIRAGTRWVIQMPGGDTGLTSAHSSGKMPRKPLDPLIGQRAGWAPEKPECRR